MDQPNDAARAGGFFLHAGLGIAPNERAKLERLCRYVSRPRVASERLALTASGRVRCTLKTPYRDGTTHIVLEPLDLMARLAAATLGRRRSLKLVTRNKVVGSLGPDGRLKFLSADQKSSGRSIKGWRL